MTCLGPKVPKLPSARNHSVSSTFLTAEILRLYLNNENNREVLLFLQSFLMLFYIKNYFYTFGVLQHAVVLFYHSLQL